LKCGIGVDDCEIATLTIVTLTHSAHLELFVTEVNGGEEKKAFVTQLPRFICSLVLLLPTEEVDEIVHLLLESPFVTRLNNENRE